MSRAFILLFLLAGCEPPPHAPSCEERGGHARTWLQPMSVGKSIVLMPMSRCEDAR